VMEAINYVDLIPKSSDNNQLFAVAINKENLKSVYTGGYLSNKEYISIYNKQLVPLDTAIKAYRGYYITCKSHLAIWTNTQKPEWYETL
ncbi:MAG: hypothetical protein R3321_01195, partial [Nitrososphaeraceae archaeon]|nr:hypothetical protein [Nitrososphaeraceae archaeon]